MIPTVSECYALWDKYNLPEKKRTHVTLVAKVALYLAERIRYHVSGVIIDMDIVRAAALLHDIDKAIPKAPGERHPDTGIRILKKEGMVEIAGVVATHSLHVLLDPKKAPKTWEEKLLFLADKMVKWEIVGVEGRFALWRAEHLPTEAVQVMDRTYPLVKEMERDIFRQAHVALEDIIRDASQQELT